MKMMILTAGLALALTVPAFAQNQGMTKEQMEQMQKALGALTQGGSKPMVDFREMKALNANVVRIHLQIA